MSHDRDATGLTKRQRQVLKARAEGLSWADIARKIGISREQVRQIKNRLIDMGVFTKTGEAKK